MQATAPRAALSRRVWLSLPLVPAALATATSLQAQAQTRPPNWIRHVNWRVKPGKRQDFEKHFLSFMKSYHQARKDAGLQASWTLTKLVFPTGEEATYHYGSHVLTANPPNLDPDPAEAEAILKKLGTTREKYLAQLQDLAVNVRSMVTARVQMVGQLEVGHVARIDYSKMAPAHMGEYFNMERNIYRPLREDQNKNGTLKAWSVNRVVYPGGTSRPADAYTLQSAKDFTELNSAIAGGAEQFAKIHPNLSYVSTLNRLNEIKQIVSTAAIRIMAIA